MPKHILILGGGSVGKRHAHNLQQLGCRISCMDPQESRLADVRKSGVDLVHGCTGLDEALAIEELDGVVVASPTAFHVDQSIAALGKGLPVLLEKPVSIDLADAQRLEAEVTKGRAPLLLGYTWRWWPALMRVRELLEQGIVGSLRSVRFVMAAHLADWHPWERYQDFFMSDQSLGGGALLDESHWIDLMLLFFGMPESLFGRVEKISDLEISSDDNVDVFAEYGDGKRVMLHLDLYTRPHEKSITFVGEKGTLRWEVDRITWSAAMEGEWREEAFDNDRNDMFMDVAREFLGVVDGAQPSCTIADGLRVMRTIEAVRESSDSGAVVIF